jgi:hypothetical protein
VILLELTEPIMQWLCRVNRLVRRGAALDFAQARGEVRSLLADARSRATREAGVLPAFEMIEPVLIVFVDAHVRSMRPGFAALWKPLATERGVVASAGMLEALIEQTLAQGAENLQEQRLALLGQMLAMGMPGLNATAAQSGGVTPAQRTSQLLAQITARVGEMAQVDRTVKVCPEAYEGVDSRVLTQPPARSLMKIGIVLVGMLIVVAAAYFQLFARSSKELRATLSGIAGGAGESVGAGEADGSSAGTDAKNGGTP